MPWFTCQNQKCGKHFYSKHSKAKYHSRSCAAQVNCPKGMKRSNTYSDEELLQALVDAAQKLGRTPSRRDLKDLECADAETYRARFESYNNAVVAAGLEPNVTLPFSYLDGSKNLISITLRYQVLKRDGFRCQYCGGTPEHGYILHVDHVIPRSEGGLTIAENLKTACWLCNTGKSNK